MTAAFQIKPELADLYQRLDHKTDYWENVDFTTTCAADLEGKQVPNRQWLVEDRIPHENVTLFSGDGGLGKTILALMLGTSLSSCTPWLGLEAMQGPFLYIGAEDDEDEIHQRVNQIRFELGFDWGKLCDFHFRSLVGEDAIFSVYDKGMMKATALMQKVEKRIEDLGAIACAIDTSADVFGGDEISRTQVRQFISLLRGVCRRRKCSIILLSHPSVAGMTSGSGISGSTGWHNSVRARVYLERVANYDDARVLKFMKSNYGPKGKPISLRYQRGLFVVDHAAQAKRTPAEADAMFLRMLDSYTDQNRHVSANKSVSYAPKVFADDKACEGFTSADLKEAMDRLLERKEVANETFGPPSKLRTRLVRVVSN
jgi:RecA-family ATPase